MEIMNIKPTVHYLTFHQDVSWDLVILVILSPTKVFPNKRRGKNRYTYIKYFKKYSVEVHVEIDVNRYVWVINAFKNAREK